MTAPQHILIYVSVSKDGRELYRSKIRELRALGSVMVRIALDRLRSEDPNAWLGADLAYVDASTGRPLLALSLEGRALLIRGEIPAAYKERLLCPEETSRSVDRAISRYAPTMEEAERELLQRTFRTRVDGLLRRIARDLDEHGRFQFTVQRP